MLEKTLDSFLDSKEIKLVNSKGNQPWIFIGRADVETEVPIHWPFDAKLTHWKRLWCWERLKAGGEGGDRGWDGWMASLTHGYEWGKPGVLQFVGSQSQTPLSDWTTAISELIILNQCFPKTYYRFKSLLIPLKCSFKWSFLNISPLPFVLVSS